MQKQIPNKIIKIWCVAHRANLVFGDLTKNNVTISSVIQSLSAIASYFHTSGIRAAGLKKIANENGLKILTMPKVFEIRWTEFTHQLFKAILKNWNAIILYFDQYPDAQNSGFKKFLTNIKKLKLISFFADLLFIYQRFHKQMQSNFLTLPTFRQYIANINEALKNLKTISIPGGFESDLQTEIVSENENFFFKNIELFDEEKSSRREPIDLNVVRSDVIDSLTKYMEVRMDNQNQDLISTIESFLKFDKTIDIKTIHSLIGKDLDMSNLYLQYTDLSNSSNEIKDQPILELLRYLLKSERIHFFSELATVIAQICACTPNSADCERVISANNNLKTN